MRNKMRKILIFTVMMIIGLANIGCVSKASFDWGTIEQQAQDFAGGAGSAPIELGNLRESVIAIGNILTAIGVAIIMVGILIIGIKYMIASPEEAAKIKGQLVGLVVAGVVIFGAYGIWSVVVNVLQSSL